MKYSDGAIHCVCCSQQSIEQGLKRPRDTDAAPSQAQATSPDQQRLLLCQNDSCGKVQYLSHAFDMAEGMRRNCSKDALHRDAWYQSVNKIQSDSTTDATTFHIAHCIACEFKANITAKKSNLQVPHAPRPVSHPPPSPDQLINELVSSVDDINLQDGDDDTEEAEEATSPVLSRKDQLAEARSAFANYPLPTTDKLSFLSGYFDESSPTRTRPYKKKKNKVKASTLRQSISYQSNPFNNPYSGAVIVPDAKLMIQSQGSNDELKADHHAFAQSASEPSLGVMHGGISQSKSEELQDFLKSNNKVMKPIPKEWIERVKLDNICSPEDPTKTRSMVLEIITIPQAAQTTTPKVTGQTDHCVDELSTFYFYSNKTTKDSVDCTIILSPLTDGNTTLSPKLLLLRFHSIINSSISDETVRRLRSIIGAVSGKHGFEMTRTGGSSGLTSNQTDRDFLHAMHEVNTALPRRCGACKITRNPLFYNVHYRKVKPKLGKTPVAHYKYCPVKPGGSFDMAPGMIAEFPFLGEFSYLKMLAVMVLHRLNDKREKDHLAPVAAGPIQREMNNIIYARRSYGNSRSFQIFVANFNLHNKYSMVCHATGLHYDIFNCGSESLENKILLVDPSQDGYNSRGGSRYGNYYCFALLDWQYEARARRRWAMANLNRWGINPTMRWNENFMDENIPLIGMHEMNVYVRGNNNDDGLVGDADGQVDDPEPGSANAAMMVGAGPDLGPGELAGELV